MAKTKGPVSMLARGLKTGEQVQIVPKGIVLICTVQVQGSDIFAVHPSLEGGKWKLVADETVLRVAPEATDFITRYEEVPIEAVSNLDGTIWYKGRRLKVNRRWGNKGQGVTEFVDGGAVVQIPAGAPVLRKMVENTEVVKQRREALWRSFLRTLGILK